MVDHVKDRINGIFDEIVSIRRHLHMHPELSNQEEETMKYISAYLTELGIPNQINVGGHGVVGIIGDPNAAFAVGLRADIDALPIQERNDVPYASQVPGVMHACGHDIHTATLLGTAKLLKEMEDQLTGAVKLFFQPAEENGGGARQMIAEGCMNNPPVSSVLGFHVDTTCHAGHILLFPEQVCACSTQLQIVVNGKRCHGARPDTGIDAIIASAHVLTALQNVASRFVSPLKPVVVTIGTIHGGTERNIVADEVRMTGTIRTLDLETRDYVKKQIRLVAEAAAGSCGATAEVMIKDGYPPIINDYETAMVMKKIADKALGEAGYTIKTIPGMGGEDFSYFADQVPSCYFRVGVLSGKEEHKQKLHNEWFRPDESCMKAAMLMEVLGVLALLERENNRTQ